MPRAFVQPIDCQQLLGCGDPRFRLTLGGEHFLSHRQCKLRQALTLLLEPAVERRVQPIQIIEHRRPKYLQTARIGRRRPGEYANVHPESLVEHDDLIAVSLQQDGGTRPQCVLQFVQRLSQ